ncbi:hypothetical protein [Leptolyngbya sp. FACHB-261]|uniref:hypothetical protein n=1 Tax=Leptolyngbya sp. FACHB-261 TaxID=2692806 RepID=UPI00168905E2|nr:hypothetical protein [Leptolyngbya sp. FACHB-261]MBD2101948.1 hypothetical protein [Leptolyngbya sp. FACHB-261]
MAMGVESSVVRSEVLDHDRVRWGPIIAGLFVALSSQLVLSALGAAIGLNVLSSSGAPRSNANEVGTGVAIWAAVSLLISLYLGGLTVGRGSLPLSRGAAILNGIVLWATTLALGSWLLSGGVSGIFGAVANNAGEIAQTVQQAGTDIGQAAQQATQTAAPPSANQVRNIASAGATTGWSFVFGSLLGLAASIFGTLSGNKKRVVRSQVIDNRPYS